MKLTLIQLTTFADLWKSLRLTDEDLQALERQLLAQPSAGDVMSGTGGVRKIRFAPPSWNRGKRGAARVCYAYFVSIGTIFLMTIFGKNEKANLSPAERATLKAWMSLIRKSARHEN